MELRALRAGPCDVLLFFNWGRDPTTRNSSVLQDPTTLGRFRGWFLKVVFSKKNCLLIIEGRNEHLVWIPIGQVRFNQHGEIGVSISHAFRGRHLATQAINTGIQYLYRHSPVRLVVAHIKQDNRVSARAFEMAGFKFVCRKTIGGHACQRYVYRGAMPTATETSLQAIS